jgi:hypothetical protein
MSLNSSVTDVLDLYKAEGRRQKAEGRRQKAEGRRQKAEGAFCHPYLVICISSPLIVTVQLKWQAA